MTNVSKYQKNTKLYKLYIIAYDKISPKNFIVIQTLFDLQLETCDDRICNDHGKCFVSPAGKEMCECSTKYSGNHSQFLTRKLLI